MLQSLRLCMNPIAPKASAPASHVLGSGIAITVKLSNWIVAVPRACQRSLKSVGAMVAVAAAWSLNPGRADSQIPGIISGRFRRRVWRGVGKGGARVVYDKEDVIAARESRR